MKYKKIALIGMMGSGKSTISKELAKKLNYALCDTDEIFEKKYNSSIADFFKVFKEEEFRKKETEILKELLQKENIVISTGGGIILKKENRDLLFQDDVLTIYLETSPEAIYNRIKNDKTRPLLLVENPKEEIKKISKNREKYYNLAKIKINTDNKSIEEILKWIK